MTVPGAVLDPAALQSEELAVSTDAGGVNAYYVRASKNGAAPSLIVIHEGFGMVEHIRDVCRRFAQAGYNALAPDLYTRVGTPDASDIKNVLATVYGIRDADVVADLAGCAAFLRSRPQATEKVGVIGFCSGGRQSLLFACSSTDVDAAAACWGGFIRTADGHNITSEARPTPVIQLVDRLACPLLAVRGEEDQNPSAEDFAELEERTAAAGKSVELHTFEAAGHAFFADYRSSYRPDAAFKLWPILLDFLTRHLA